MFGICTAPHVAEVRGLATVVVYHVECCHDEPCSIPHNSNVSIEFDEGQAVLASFCFYRGDFCARLFGAFLKLGMAEEAVVVNYHPQVCGDELAITCLDERITLDKLRIID